VLLFSSQPHIDRFLVSNTVLPSIQTLIVIEHGGNLSDHLPIMLAFALTPTLSRPRHINRSASVNAEKKMYCLWWDKGDLVSYYYRSRELLSRIKVPVGHLDEGHMGIESCYNATVHSLQLAANETIPNKPTDFLI